MTRLSDLALFLVFIVILTFVQLAQAETCAGCPVDGTSEDEEMVRKWVGGTLKSVNSNSEDRLRLNKILGIQKQLVSGVKYTIDVEISNDRKNCLKTCQFVYLLQVWKSEEPTLFNENCTEIKDARSKRQQLGGFKEIEGEEMDTVKELTDYAIKTLDEIDADSSKQIVTNIISAKKQLVNGIMYHVEVQVKTTSCPEEEEAGEECSEIEVAPMKLCKLKIHRSWADKSPVNAKVVESVCSPVQKKREILLGGRKPANENDEDIQKLADFAIEHINKEGMSNSIYVQGLVGISKAENQVVAGYKTYLTLEVGDTNCLKSSYKTGDNCKVSSTETSECDVEIYERPWENVREVSKANCRPKQDKVRQKREPQITVGGVSPLGTNDENARRAARIGLAELDKSSNSNFKTCLHRIVSANTQVVAGTKTTVTMEVGDSSCGKGQNCANSCANNRPTQRCTVSVWERPWLNAAEVTEKSCQNLAGRKKREVLGGSSNVDVNDKEVMRHKEFIEQELSRKTNSLYTKQIVQFIDATTQVVSGKLTKLTVEVGETDCLQSENKPASECKLTEKDHDICKLTIWEQPWLNKKTIEDIKCTKNIPREKRSPQGIPGGVSPLSPDHEDSVGVANIALAKLEETSNSNFKTCLHRIIGSTTQVVAGTKTTVIMEVGESSCAKGQNCANTCSSDQPTQKCTVSVWERPWLGKAEVTEQNCENIASRTKRQLGGDSNADVNDNEITRHKEFIEQELTNRANSLHTKKVVKIISATTQVVSGKLTKLTVEVGETNCLKSENKPITECNLTSSDEKDHETCKVTIWEQPWLNKKTVEESDCHKNQPITGTNGKESSGSLHRKRDLSGEEEDEPEFQQFLAFTKKYRKFYGNLNEFQRRYHIFRGNLKKIAYLRKTEQGTGVYGPTELADLSSKEFKKHYLGLNLKTSSNLPQRPMAVIPNVTLPDEFDWRNFNAVTPVKNQAMCGSCWAFSVTGNIEGQWAIKNNQLLSLSEQELVDCDKYDNGCNGGLFDTAFHAIEDLGGLETEADYPYEGYNDKCKLDRSDIKVSISGAVNISHDETDMAKWLTANGPISVALNANAMQFYMGGVSKPLKFLCNPKDLDHGVLIVGFGVHKGWITHKNLPYWIVKNSWGTHWGKQGYYWLYRGEGTCGINQMPSSAVL